MAAGQLSAREGTKTRTTGRKGRKSSADHGENILQTADTSIDAAVDAADLPEEPGSPATDDNMHNNIPSPQLQHMRRRQNRVGKRYRDKLTSCFETLQVTLGVDEVGARMDGSMDGTEHGVSGGRRGRTRARHRPLNKAEVLDLTCERVKSLLQQWEEVKAARDALQKQREAEGW